MKQRLPTSFRLREEDIEILKKLQELTGLESYTAVIRVAIREALAARERRARR